MPYLPHRRENSCCALFLLTSVVAREIPMAIACLIGYSFERTSSEMYFEAMFRALPVRGFLFFMSVTNQAVLVVGQFQVKKICAGTTNRPHLVQLMVLGISACLHK